MTEGSGDFDGFFHAQRNSLAAQAYVLTHDVEEAVYLGQRVVLMAPRPGRIDREFAVPLPARREQTMKHTAAFLALKSQIIERIRTTSGLKTDTGLLEKLSRRAADGADHAPPH